MFGPALALAVLLAAPAAQAACEVDVYDVRLSADLREKRERVWIYVSAAPDGAGRVVPCRQLRLPVDPGAELLQLDLRLRRGDRRGARLDRARARVLGAADGGAELVMDVPELEVGEVLDLRLRWRVDPALGLSWDPAAFGPTDQARLRLPARAPLPPGAPRPPRGPISAGAPAPTQLAPRAVPVVREPPGAAAPLRVDLRPSAAPGAGSPPAGTQRWSLLLTLGPGEGAFLPWPAGATGRACKATAGATALLEPLGCRVAGGEGGQVEIGAELPLSVTLDHCAAGWPGSRVPVGGLELSAWSQPLRPTDSGWGSAPGAGLDLRVGREAGPAGACRAWLRAVDGQVVVDQADDLVQILARASLMASVPEPGLPLELKHLDAQQTPPAVLADAVIDWQRGELRVAPTPDQRTFAPRPLIDVRREGVASPWEAALLLTRRLRQLKLPAEPVLLRTGPPVDPSVPFGWDAALVELPTADGLLRYDPACRSCAPQELHPRLWGAAVLGQPGGAPGLALPAGRAGWALEGSGRERILVAELAGPPALLLRERLAALPPAARQTALEAAVGGLKLREHAGLEKPGAPVRLVFAAPAGRGPVPLPQLDEGAAWPGLRSWRVGPVGAATRWERTQERPDAPVERGPVEAEWLAAQQPAAPAP
jgi:hypothetical protein